MENRDISDQEREAIAVAAIKEEKKRIRREVATAAMQGIISSGNLEIAGRTIEEFYNSIASNSVAFADALLAKLEDTGEER